MKIYHHICKSCSNEYKDVIKFPSICTDCKALIIKWFEVVQFIDKEGFKPDNFIKVIGLKM